MTKLKTIFLLTLIGAFTVGCGGDDDGDTSDGGGGGGGGSTFSQTQGYNLPMAGADKPISNQSFVFSLGGATPSGAGTVTISNLIGDTDKPGLEQWKIQLTPGPRLGTTNNGTACTLVPAQVFPVTQAQLEAAIVGNNITIQAINGGGIDLLCSPNTMDITLSFPTI